MIGTANVTLSIDKIKTVPVPIISPKTQKWICDFCETCDELTKSLKEQENIKSKLLKTLVA
jgi:restriction endonuclease S subunit